MARKEPGQDESALSLSGPHRIQPVEAATAALTPLGLTVFRIYRVLRAAVRNSAGELDRRAQRIGRQALANLDDSAAKQAWARPSPARVATPGFSVQYYYETQRMADG
jgi:hypothetical protein